MSVAIHEQSALNTCQVARHRRRPAGRVAAISRDFSEAAFYLEFVRARARRTMAMDWMQNASYRSAECGKLNFATLPLTGGRLRDALVCDLLYL